MNISAPFIVRPIATTLLVVAVVLVGLIGYRFLSVAALPTVEFPIHSGRHSLSGRVT